MQADASWRLKALHRQLLETPGADRFRSVLLYIQSSTCGLAGLQPAWGEAPFSGTGGRALLGRCSQPTGSTW